MFQMRRKFSDRLQDRGWEAARGARRGMFLVRDRGAQTGRRAYDRSSEAARYAYDRGSEAARYAYDRGSEAARVAYDYAMNHRKATAAVLLGAGLAAALVWMVRRNGGYAATRQRVLERVRRRDALAHADTRIQTP